MKLKIIKNIITYLIGSILFTCFSGCNSNHHIVRKIKYQDIKTLEAIDFWESKIKFLSQTGCVDFDNPANLKKEYLLKVCEYYKALSPSNIEYDKNLKKYVISQREVKEIILDIFGWNHFEFNDENYYDKEYGVYIFNDYINIFDNNQYSNQEIIKLDDQRLKFSVLLYDQVTGMKKMEIYILKSDDNKNYYVVSKVSQNSKYKIKDKYK